MRESTNLALLRISSGTFEPERVPGLAQEAKVRLRFTEHTHGERFYSDYSLLILC